MVEKYELNLFAKHRHLLKDVLPDKPESQRIGVTLRGTVGDPLFVRIGELDRSLRESGHGVAFGSCVVKRTYSKEEIERAELFFINIPFTHVAGEEYGTEYQEANDCDQQAFDMEWPEVNKCRPVPVMVPCGICSKQEGLLRVPFRKLSKKKDIFRAWGGELIVSERLAAVIRDGSFAGSVLFSIRDVKGEQTAPFDFSSHAGVELLSIASAKGMQPKDAKFWWWLYKDAPKPLLDEVIAQLEIRIPKEGEEASFRRNLAQLVLQSKPLEVSERSRFGYNAFDTASGGHFQCKSGEIAGIQPISSLSVIRASWDGSDLCRTGVYTGGRQGLFRPFQLLVVSKRFLKAMQQAGMKGFDFEVVEMV